MQSATQSGIERVFQSDAHNAIQRGTYHAMHTQSDTHSAIQSDTRHSMQSVIQSGIEGEIQNGRPSEVTLRMQCKVAFKAALEDTCKVTPTVSFKVTLKM